MSKFNGNQVLSFVVYAVMLTLALTFVFGSLVYPGRLRLVPLVIGIPTVLLLVYIILMDINPKLFSLARNKGEDGTEAGAPSEPSVNSGQWQRVITIYGWIVGFFIGVFIFGFYIATPLFLVSFLIKESQTKPMRALWVTAGVSILFLLVFYVLLDIPLWPGILPMIIPHMVGGGSIPPLYRGL